MAQLHAAQIESDIVERALRMRDDFATNEKLREVYSASAREHDERANLYSVEASNWRPLTGIEWQQAAATAARDGAAAALAREQEHTEILERDRISTQTSQIALQMARDEIRYIVERESMQNQIDSLTQDLLAQVLANQALVRHEEERGRYGSVPGASWQENFARYLLQIRNNTIQNVKNFASQVNSNTPQTTTSVGPSDPGPTITRDPARGGIPGEYLRR